MLNFFIENNYIVKREEKYDCFSKLGYVPKPILFDDDWWFYCDCCGTKFSKDDYGTHSSNHYHVDNKLAFCSQECVETYYTELKIKLNEQRDLFKSLRTKLNRDDIRVISCCGGNRYPIYLTFRLPDYTIDLLYASNNLKVVTNQYGGEVILL